MPTRKLFKAKNGCQVTFQLPQKIKAQSAVLVGEFNDWDATANPMKKVNSHWETTLTLKQESEYQYHYLVNGAKWFNDRGADKYVLGNINGPISVVVTHNNLKSPVAQAEESGSRWQKRILIVDDEEIICTILERCFETLKPDYNVVVATDGFVAVDQLQQQSFDLVMTDHQMAGMNGLELAKIARQVSPATRIVLMTGTNYLIPASKVKTLGLDGYIEKPFSPTQILDIVNHVLSIGR